MAADALGGKARKLSYCNILVARIAVSDRVCAKQREPILVLFNRPHRYSPSIHGVTAFALRTHLAAMNVRVTIGAAQPDIRKHRTYMALLARDSLMHAAQRILRPVVIELGNIANRFPSRERMAVLARNVEGAVRTMGRNRVLRLLRRHAAHYEQHK